MGILQKIYEDETAQGALQDILGRLQKLSDPEQCKSLPNYVNIDPPDAKLATDENKLLADRHELVFVAQLDALIGLKRLLDVTEGNVKIGYWCCRESEKGVKGMDSWPVYWLTIWRIEPVPLEITDARMATGLPPITPEYTELELSIWASGKDDNTIQKGIRSWVECHFPIWEVKKLRSVRR